MLGVTNITKISYLINFPIYPIQHNCNGIFAFDTTSSLLPSLLKLSLFAVDLKEESSVKLLLASVDKNLLLCFSTRLPDTQSQLNQKVTKKQTIN